MASSSPLLAAPAEQLLLERQYEHFEEAMISHREARPKVDLAFRNVSYVVQGNKRILHELSGEVNSGEMVALMGPSGRMVPDCSSWI